MKRRTFFGAVIGSLLATLGVKLKPTAAATLVDESGGFIVPPEFVSCVESLAELSRPVALKLRPPVTHVYLTEELANDWAIGNQVVRAALEKCARERGVVLN